MSANTPPDPYFSGINFNPSFFIQLATNYLTETIANSKYLRLIGGTLSGLLGIKRTARTELDVNGKAVINDGVVGPPANGVLGGNGTKLILYEGSTTETPFAIGIDSFTQWYGTPTAGSHKFYAGTTNTMTLNSSSVLDLFNNTLSANSPFISLRGGGGAGNTVGINLTPLYSRTGGASSQIFAIDDGYLSSHLVFSTAPAGTSSTLQERMRILNNGNIGIGTNTPNSLLDLYNNTLNANSPFISLRGGGGANNQVGINLTPLNSRSGGTSAQIVAIDDGNASSHLFFSTAPSGGSSTLQERMRILNNGNIGIGTNNPGNILQIGDGARLRISNNSTDYTVIGTKTGDDGNNSRIVISGYQRGVNAGCIEHLAATDNGIHRFYISASYTEILAITSTDFQISTSCTTYGDNYYNDGQYIGSTSKTNTSGTTLTGYFISCEFWFNSFVKFCVSHNDASYTYWHGFVGTNNSTAPMYVTSYNNFNHNVQSFQEQGTNKYYLYCRPAGTYNGSVQLRVKFTE